MYTKITDFGGIYKEQQIEKSLFNLDSFVPGIAAFPKRVFRKTFATHLFLDFNDWFNKADEHARLRKFVDSLGERFYVAAVPSHYLLNPVKFSSDCTHHDFVKGFTFSSEDGHDSPAKNVGLRLSSQTMLYGESQSWAMVSDLTHNVIIAGLDHKAVAPFEAAFHGQFFDIEQVIRKLEEFQGGKMDGASQVLQTYRNK